jgi:hypothetical protein
MSVKIVYVPTPATPIAIRTMRISHADNMHVGGDMKEMRENL